MMRLVRGTLWMVAILSLQVGCAAQRRENYVRDKAAEHVYVQPLDEMWPRVEAVMEEKGYYWREMPNRYVLETEWKENGGGTLGHSYTRFLIEGMRTRGGSVLRVMRNDASSQPTAIVYAGTTGGHVSAAQAAVDAANSNTTGMTEMQKAAFRDLELELEFLQAIDPQAAASLEQDALAKYPK